MSAWLGQAAALRAQRARLDPCREGSSPSLRRASGQQASTINRTLRTLAKRCKLRPLHPHALRHSCATFLKAKKVDVIVIRDILGHSQLSVTADIYTHVLAPELREAIDKMDLMLGGEAGES